MPERPDLRSRAIRGCWQAARKAGPAVYDLFSKNQEFRALVIRAWLAGHRQGRAEPSDRRRIAYAAGEPILETGSSRPGGASPFLRPAAGAETDNHPSGSAPLPVGRNATEGPG